MPQTQFAARRLEVQPDVPDTRDRLYECAPKAPPAMIPVEEFKRFAGPVVDQGEEPSCTGMALAGVANYMLRRHWNVDAEPVSPRMMYEMARRHDHLSDDLEGSNPRGAIKGWHKHGVCSEALWPYAACTKHGRLTFARVVDASKRMLGGYARVDRRDLDAMRWAIAEHGVLFASSMLHTGWDNLDGEHVIPHHPGDKQRGGHAFVIAGYDERGFWIQNSWGRRWGRDGCAVLTYEDWLENGLDVWVAEIDEEILRLAQQAGTAEVGESPVALFRAMWPHVVVIGDDGRLTSHGSFAAAPEDLVALVEHFEDATRLWETRRVALVAGAGLTHPNDAVREAASIRAELLKREIYPVFLVWRSPWFEPIAEMLERLAAKQGGGEDLAERLEQKASRSVVQDAAAEVEGRATAAIESSAGAARLLVDRLLESFVRSPFEIHLVAHGAGDVLMSGLAQYLEGAAAACGAKINSCTLWAPATTVARFAATYQPLLERGTLEHVGLFVLDEDHEKADSFGPYQRSVLHLLAKSRGVDVLGMEGTLNGDAALRQLRKAGDVDVVVAPTGERANELRRSEATTHAGFLTDEATIRATMRRILGSAETPALAIESRDPLVRARALYHAEQKAEKLRHELAAMEHCEECDALRERAGVG